MMDLKKPDSFSGIHSYGAHLLFLLILSSVLSCKKEKTQTISNSNENPTAATGSSGLTRQDSVGTFTNVYKYSGPVSLNGISNETISGDSINCLNTQIHGITLNNCHNIHITKVKIYNSASDGIYLSNCSDITIDTCYINNVLTGVNVTYSTGVTVNYNQMKNMLGPVPKGQFVQFNNVYGAGNSVTNNNLENIFGVGNPEDAISMYESNGTAASPIMISGNWIRGGGPSRTGGGINLGDDGGSYQIAENNVLVNPGQYGIAVSAGTNMQILNNQVYGVRNTFTNVGIDVWNQYTSISGCSMITVNGNHVNYVNAYGTSNGSWSGNNCGTLTGWTTGNNWNDGAVTASILPAIIITQK